MIDYSSILICSKNLDDADMYMLLEKKRTQNGLKVCRRVQCALPFKGREKTYKKKKKVPVKVISNFGISKDLELNETR